MKKRDIKDVDLGDLVEERFHCSNPKDRYKRLFLVIAEPTSIFVKRPNTYICNDVETGREVIKTFIPRKNITYHIMG